MQDLYKHEHDAIVNIVDGVRERFMDGSKVTPTKLHNLHRELSGRLEDAGFDAVVDVTPLLDGMPPVVAINGRKEKVYDFDHEKKAWEVKQRQIEKGEDPKIEGVV